MFKRKKKNRTPAAQATRAQSNILARLVGCGFLVYILVKLVRTEDIGAWGVLKISVAVILGLAALIIIALTLIEFIKNIRQGVYLTGFYEANNEAEGNDDSENPPNAE